MKTKTSLAAYLVLFCLIAVTLVYQLAGAAALVDFLFDLRKHADPPVNLDHTNLAITETKPEAQKAGLAKGDIVDKLNGQILNGGAQWRDLAWRAHPGDTFHVEAHTPGGKTKVAIITFQEVRHKPSLGESTLLIFLHIAMPLFCLVLGYWVVLARPGDSNAWLIFILLTVTEVLFPITTSYWRPGGWLMLRLSWHLILTAAGDVALLWFGFYFPERSRIDRRFPLIKWIISFTFVLLLVAALWEDYGQWYDKTAALWRSWYGPIENYIWSYSILCCTAFYALAVADKLRSASSADARRRMRVLAVGSVVGIGSVWLIWGFLPRFGIDPDQAQWLGYLSILLFLIFPLSLAYVVIVQRALDVRILLRIGTKYALARTTLLVAEIALAIALIFGFIVPVFGREHKNFLDILISLAAAAFLIWLFALRGSLSSRLQNWLDRKFFREAYNSEILLTELAEQVRHFKEPQALLHTVACRVSEVLHVPQVAVFLRQDGRFQLQQVIGLSTPAYAEIPATFEMTRANTRKAHSQILPTEQVFAETNMEVLLPLLGRERLMGLMTLGPKQSEEAYSASDLRLLDSIGTQTGLSLEITELANSLASEAAQRQRMTRELEIAREVQERLFPQQIPVRDGVELAGYCRPALGVGGDYYDMIDFEDGRIGLAIGDVSGKGISAALLMASLRASLRGMAMEGPLDLASLMKKLNRLVYESSAVNRYATFFFAVYQPQSHELRYVNAGHNPPMVLRRTDSGRETLRLEAGGAVVGLLRDLVYEEQSVQLQQGDIFLGYTDGISEAMTVDDEEWGEERLLATAEGLCAKPAAEMIAAIFTAADSFTAGATQHDDMTLLIMKQSSPSSRLAERVAGR